ncbi:hypothetical protein BH20ACT16_BH20ACT16_14550 [soil metagenome]|jgi:hypothetical protein
MADDEILRRLDAHMVRGNEIMARSNEVMTEFRLEMAEHREAMAEHRQGLAEIRFELSQMSLRGERVAQGFLAELRLMREERERGRDDGRKAHEDYREESRAHRQALFTILDELKRRGSGGPAAA